MNTDVTIKNLDILIRARYPMILCTTFEELRLSAIVAELCKRRGADLYVWTRTKGMLDPQNKAMDKSESPDRALKYIEEAKGNICFLLKDFHPYLKDPQIIRQLRDLCQNLKLTKKNMILVSPVSVIPTELSKEIAVLDLPLPNRKDIEELYRRIPQSIGIDTPKDESLLQNCVEAALGLTQEEIENVFAKSLVAHGSIDVQEILTEKRQIVQKSGILDFIPVNGDFDSIGGLENLKQWLQRRKDGFSQEAERIHLPSPKGILLLGIPGCGKSLTAVCTGAAWKMPVLRLDIGKVFSGLVGSSEQNMRAALKTAESVSPCILWIDEIEKGLSGTSSSGASDGGTTSRVFGTFLTWMQERERPVFVLATANDISQLPPEMLRKGRFDEIFFVDIPKPNERLEILNIHLKKRGWEVVDFDEAEFREATEEFSGAEIEQALVAARYDAFFQKKQLTMPMLKDALRSTVPLTKTLKEKIESMRAWASHRAVMASSEEKSGGEEAPLRKLELAQG